MNSMRRTTMPRVAESKKAFFTSTDHRGYKFGLVRMYVAHYRISWIIFISDLVISYTDKLLVFRRVQIGLLL